VSKANKCHNYIKENLRNPPSALIKKWGRTAGLSAADINAFKQRLPLTFKLGRVIIPNKCNTKIKRNPKT
jgi:hypothetical protein